MEKQEDEPIRSEWHALSGGPRRARLRFVIGDALQSASAIATVLTLAASVVVYVKSQTVREVLLTPVPLPIAVVGCALIALLLLLPRSAGILWARLRGRHRIVALGDVEKQLGPRLLGAVPSVITNSAHPLVTDDGAPNAFIESFKRI